MILLMQNKIIIFESLKLESFEFSARVLPMRPWRACIILKSNVDFPNYGATCNIDAWKKKIMIWCTLSKPSQHAHQNAQFFMLNSNIGMKIWISKILKNLHFFRPVQINGSWCKRKTGKHQIRLKMPFFQPTNLIVMIFDQNHG